MQQIDLRMTSFSLGMVAVLAALPAASACNADSQEVARVQLPAVSSSTEIQSVTTDLGYTVDVHKLRAVVKDFEFTTEGEFHDTDSVLNGLFWTNAYAHPGHRAGGETIGELRGRFVVDWTNSEPSRFGHASLLAGEYTGANIGLAQATADDGLADDDPLIGHFAQISATATRQGQSIDFRALVDQDNDRRVIGAPFQAQIDADTRATLALTLHTKAPREDLTLFDGIDFAELDGDGDGEVVFEAGSGANNRLKRALQIHDFYSVSVQ